LPILAALVVALVAALAYAALGGHSSASAPSLAPLRVPGSTAGIAVSRAPAGTDQAVAETTSGASKQRGGVDPSRNPFAPVAGAPETPAQLTTYRKMTLNQPLPSKDNAQLVFLGVVLHTGTEAVFALTGAAILHGSAVCVPSPTQCRGIKLQVGQSETLDTF